MNDINQLFFELIRVSLGNQERLSRVPTAKEWERIYRMAVKQSLLGICFAGVQRLGANADEGFSAIGMPEMLYLTWMGMAAKIQQRNEVVNRQCVELLSKLIAKGCNGCILKGQGIATQYVDGKEGTNSLNSSNLSMLRQSGDIDVWIEGGLDNTLKLARDVCAKPSITEHHIDLPLFEGTDVEAHFTPSYLRCPWYNRRLQLWFNEQSAIQFANRNDNGWCVPTTEFNLVFLMLHAFRHLTSEGIGLRQVMDYYFVLKSASASQRKNAFETLCQLGVNRFCGAMMYVQNVVFCMDGEALLCVPNENEGKYLLNEIMTGGNFGQYDERTKINAKETKMSRYLRQTRRNIYQFTHYPAEAFFSPWWRAKIWVWRKWNGWI